MEKQNWKAAVSGGAAGIINGFFGGGGGMLLVPLLIRWQGLEEQKAFATSVAIILPLCCLSSAIYFLRGDLVLEGALPYLLGGTVGGMFGGKLFKGVNMLWLRRGFAILILYAGIRAAFFAS